MDFFHPSKQPSPNLAMQLTTQSVADFALGIPHHRGLELQLRIDAHL
jgi:hypothetical protein